MKDPTLSPTMRLALLAALLLALPAAAQPAAGFDLKIDARIMFETVVDAQGPNAARVVVAVPDGAPAPTQIAFAPDARTARRALIDLAPAGDGTFVGTGRAPAPERIETVVVSAGTGRGAGRYRLVVPAGWEEGVAALQYRVQPADGVPSAGTVEATLTRTDDPVVLGFTIGMPPGAR
ncbi:hypothetical protein [Rubrivirga sp. IMCC45206]|uniref:hypothetical protein n=1 Tax=Rubrivirga sp. IMCC45206 TaxID=3391614 RepID=UPI0039901614